MAQTCTTLRYLTFEIDDVEGVEVNTDIVSKDITGYFIIVDGNKHEVSEEVYEAVKTKRGF